MIKLFLKELFPIRCLALRLPQLQSRVATAVLNQLQKQVVLAYAEMWLQGRRRLFSVSRLAFRTNLNDRTLFV